MKPLFTIGHSTHDFETFLGLLQKHQIEVVADVRSQPRSRLEWFCRSELEKRLKQHKIRYVFMGLELGARRDEPECYIDLRADYDRISDTAAFHSGIERLKVGIERYRVALMCSEKEPLDCHRTVLVCRHAKEFADVSHIHADGHLETHAEAETRMMSRYVPEEGDLFRSRMELLNAAYKRRGKEINYVEKPVDIEQSNNPSIMREDPSNYES